MEGVGSNGCANFCTLNAVPRVNCNVRVCGCMCVVCLKASFDGGGRGQMTAVGLFARWFPFE